MKNTVSVAHQLMGSVDELQDLLACSAGMTSLPSVITLPWICRSPRAYGIGAGGGVDTPKAEEVVGGTFQEHDVFKGDYRLGDEKYQFESKL